jgi:small subunit ribosomal protein S3Ae
VKNVKGKLVGEPKKIAFFHQYIRKNVRKGSSYVEDSFVCKTKEGRKLRIKPLLVTRRRISRSLGRALRRRARELVGKFCENATLPQIFNTFIFGILQQDMAKKLRKLYPLSFCEIRMAEVL